MEERKTEHSLVLIHVRFANDGSVLEIGERPVGITAQGWFDRLSHRPAIAYETLSGGRAVFRMTRDEVDSLKANGAVKA